jgi:ribosomal protein S12 methylthiotransferase accessory factor
VPEAFDGEIDWTAARSLSDGATRWLPSQLCFGRYGVRAKCVDTAWRADSNGCAAGPTREKALAHALLELVERDATGIWWYGQVRRPAVPHRHLQDHALEEALKARTRLGQRVRLLGLTHDLEIPVVAAILTDADGSLQALGFGCDLAPARAIRSAYREMCQMELSIAFARHRVALAGEAARPEDRRLLTWLAEASTLPHLQPIEELAARSSSNDVLGDEQTIQLVCNRLRRAGLEAYAIDMERAEIGVPVVRAFVPGLCHYKPRLGFKRLIEVPRAPGWRDASFGQQDLSRLPLLI